jgi:hypothetical protein
VSIFIFARHCNKGFNAFEGQYCFHSSKDKARGQ